MDTDFADNIPVTKGQRTRAKIVAVATEHFARWGFEAAGLRDIAVDVGIQVPGLYKYFPNKLALYDEVLQQAFMPLQLIMQRADTGELDVAALPRGIVSCFTEHASTAALMQQALSAREDEAGEHLGDWLADFFHRGAQLMGPSGSDEVTRYLAVINAFNMTCGYFLSANLWRRLDMGEVTDQHNVDKQLRALEASIGAILTR